MDPIFKFNRAIFTNTSKYSFAEWFTMPGKSVYVNLQDVCCILIHLHMYIEK